MASVTSVTKKATQPKGGYLPIKLFTKERFEDGKVLHQEENINPGLVGLAVDYLSRFMQGASVDAAFHISTRGAFNIKKQDVANDLKSKIHGLDDTSIICACKLSGFDVCFRASSKDYQPVETIEPDQHTIENIRIMVERCSSFFEKYGPVLCSEPTFEGGYSSIIDSGDGDFVTKDTLWDLKVIQTSPTTKHTLQLLTYYVMGLHSKHDYFKSLSNLGFFNPRLNIVYLYPISSLSQNLIEDVENNVIGYGISPDVVNQKKKKENPLDSMYSVAEIERITGKRKSEIYKDIRNGVLAARKISNRYCVTQESLLNYIEHLKRIETITKIIAFSILGGFVLFVLYFLYSGGVFS